MHAGQWRHLADTIFLVVAPLCAAACAASGGNESTGTSTSGALVAVLDPATAAAAQVTDSSVSFPASSMATLSAHKPGDVLVSPRVAGSPGNGTGFLRTYASAAMQDGRYVVTTEPATLPDVVPDGSAHHTFTVPTSSTVIDIGKTVLASFTVDLGTVDSSLAGDILAFDATLDDAHVDFKPDLDFSMAFAHGQLDTMHLAVKGALTASMAMDVEAQIKGKVVDAGIASLQHYNPSFKQRIWSSPEWSLPTVWIGIVPIEESVQMYLTAKCTLSFQGFDGGVLQVHAGASGTSTVDGALDYASGAWKTSDGASLDGDGTLTVQQGATESLFCQIAPSLAVRFYDVAGPEFAVGAGLDLALRQPDASQGGVSDSTWSASPELKATVQGDIGILGYGATFGPYTLYKYLGSPIAGSSGDPAVSP